VRAASAFGARAAAERVRAQFGAAEAEALGRFEVGGHEAALRAAGAVLAYLEETQRQVPGHLTRIQRLDLADHVVLTESAVRTLELVEGQHDRGMRGSLLGAIDRTLTPMGGRLLRQWLLRPLRDPARIAARQAGVDALVGNPAARARLRAALAGLGDVARLAGRIALGVGTPRELGALRGALRGLPELRALALGLGDSPLREWAERIEDLAPLRERLEAALVEEPPTTVHEGAIIRESYSPALGDLRRETAEARAWIAGLEGRERARTGIATLRVRFNRVFGYGIEISQAHAARVPPEYVRRQTLTGAERYVTPELREHEARLLGAEERARRLELELFEELRRAAAREADRLLGTAHAVAVLDTLAGLAEVAHAQGYARPVVDDSTVLEIRAGRHPVLEAGPAGAGFVANDLVLDGHEVDCLIITGPNMAGKSTYMRQAALIVLLAQIGSFVPARSARIGVVDRVFTRIGAQDNLAQGQSTFLVEMTETAAILRHATDRSLVLLDEIGRGTSTFDGLAIAWAVAEHLHERCAGAKVLFATHYHELTRLAQELPRIRNVHVAVRESRDDIVFLHTVVPGSTDRSYGIQVARLAGLPHPVVERARALLGVLERASADPPIDAAPALAAADGPGEAERQALAELARLDLDRLTPLEALNTLAELRRRLRGPV
jgi:DNA mismatch repair protein MutS